MKKVRPIDAVYLRRKVVQMRDRMRRGKQNATFRAEMAMLETIQRLIDKTATLEGGNRLPCTGCAWKGERHQKCSCCRRNANMKDNYMPMEESEVQS